MANFEIRDGDVAEKYLKATGAGSSGDPFVIEHLDTNSAAMLTALQLIDNPVFVDDAAFTPGTSSVMVIGAQCDDTGTDSVNEGDAGAVRMSASRNLYIQVRDGAGNERGLYVDANGEIGIGSIRTSIVPGTSATHLGKAIDVAAGGSDTGVAVLAIRDDTLTTLTPADGDWSALRVDSTGRLHVTGGGGTQYAEDAPHASGDTGTLALAVRKDSAAQLADTDGDYCPLVCDSQGRLHVTGAGGGSQYIEDDAHASGDTGTIALVVRRDTAAAGVSADGDYACLSTDSSGKLWTNAQVTGDALTALQLIDNLVLAEDAAHASTDAGVQSLAVRTDSPANRSGADGDYEPLQMSAGRLWTSATITAVVPGTSATSLGKAEDDAHTSGDTGVQALAVRTDTPANRSGTDGDYEPLQMSAGRLWTSATVTAISAGETHIGQVGAPGDVVDVTLTLDTSAYASGDLIADTQSFTGVRVNGGRAILQSLTVIDEDDQGVAFTVFFLSANNTFGSENSAPSISDASARDILGWVDVATTDYKDLGGVRIACIKGINLVLEAAGGSTNLYLAVVNSTGTPTYTASGVRLKLGLLWD